MRLVPLSFPCSLQPWLTRDLKPNDKQFIIIGLIAFNPQRKYQYFLSHCSWQSKKNCKIQELSSTRRITDALPRLYKSSLAPLESKCAEIVLYRHGNLLLPYREHGIFHFTCCHLATWKKEVWEFYTSYNANAH